MSGDDLVFKAMLFAERVHKNQKRKYTGAPYITHLAEVAAITHVYFPQDKEAIAVAWLHDCVEDQGVTREELELHFNNIIADGVLWLSDTSKPEDGNREKRKEIDRLHILAAPIRWQNVKLADLISNTRDILEHDSEGFGRVYLQEKKALMQLMNGVDEKIFLHAMRVSGAFEGIEAFNNR